MKIIAIDRQGKEHTLEGRDGWSVMEILRDGGLDVAAECGGACACATCHVHVDPAWLSKLPPMEDLEDMMLGLVDSRDANSRLSCQLKAAPELDGLILNTPQGQH